MPWFFSRVVAPCRWLLEQVGLYIAAKKKKKGEILRLGGQRVGGGGGGGGGGVGGGCGSCQQPRVDTSH